MYAFCLNITLIFFYCGIVLYDKVKVNFYVLGWGYKINLYWDFINAMQKLITYLSDRFSLCKKMTIFLALHVIENFKVDKIADL